MKVKLNNEEDNKLFEKKNIFLQKTKLPKKTKYLAIFLSSLFIITLLFFLSIFCLHDKKGNFINKTLLRHLNDLNFNIEENENCLTYNGKTSECSSCKSMYNLINGLCEPNYSIKAIYNTQTENEEVKLINDIFLKYIKEITINNTKIST